MTENTVLKKEVNKYLKEVESNIHADNEQKQKFSASLEEEINAYVEANNIENISEIREHFGKPESICGNISYKDEKRKLKKVFGFKTVIIGILLLIMIYIIVICTLTTYSLTHSDNAEATYFYRYDFTSDSTTTLEN